MLDSAEVGGVPQIRRRVYLVGVKRSLMKQHAFEWPTDIPAPKLSRVIGKSSSNSEVWLPSAQTCMKTLASALTAIKDNDNMNAVHALYAIDIQQSESRGLNYSYEMCPTLTRTRCGMGGYYLSTHGRMLTSSEMLTLQGYKDVSKTKVQHNKTQDKPKQSTYTTTATD